MASSPGSGTSSAAGVDPPSYFSTRFAPDPHRDRVWRHVVDYLERWWPEGSRIVDVGAGYCSFINAARGSARTAVDVHDRLAEYAAPGVEAVRASATSLPFADGSFDVVFASNLLEHLSREEIAAALTEFRRVLGAGGRVVLVQPNFRLCAAEYFDDYTHLTPLSDRSLADLLVVHGFRLLHVEPRFLPLTLKSRASSLSALVPAYLRSPWRPRAGQMLLVAEASRRADGRGAG